MGVPASGIFVLCFAAYLACSVLKRDEGTKDMQEISGWVREGAQAYIRRQSMAVSLFFLVVFVILLALVQSGYFTYFVPLGFLSGGFFSWLAGFIGLSIATRASHRTTAAAKSSLNEGLRVAFSSGAVMGFTVVGLGILQVSLWYCVLEWYYRHLEETERIRNITSTLLTSGMGASSLALFARVGGGIFTKAADVGADLVGKVEAGIPEDDPRNPAVIADNVGDNVGDVAGMGADLYESYVGSIVATMALGVAAFGKLGLTMQGIILPMVIAAVGVLASVIGTFFVRTGEKLEQAALLAALRRGVFVSGFLIAVVSFLIIKFQLGTAYLGIYWAILSGLVAGILIGLASEFFTSNSYPPARHIAKMALTGHATLIIEGLSVGMLSTVAPVLVVGATVLASFYLSGGAHSFSLGLYGVSIAAVGMLSTLGITLATDAYGPVADNAGGNAQMSHQPPVVRERTDALDALGNTTAATGKGFAIGSAALTALALIAAYTDQIEFLGGRLSLSLLNPPVLIGLFVGGMLPFLFCSLCMKAVGRAAGGIVVEVRRQFKEIKGIMEGTGKPDYARCVDISTRAALKEMILPSLLAILVPLAMGLFMGLSSEVGFLAGATVSGFILAIMMANCGGAWDNAKKYIEGGEFGGKGSPAHKAAVVGDTVGDPLKDTAGPSLNILIKLMSIVSIVFASFIMHHSFFK
ncbi:MAG: sodium-translocating pyrophosphatase [Candidatus Omnitrophica bacterium]|nr:sodium-translocating pyrophosphatase [Candidatus Omnitrophota bacterium]